METQKVLSTEQVEAFYHDEFVSDQVRHFVELFAQAPGTRRVVDVGGGCGFFARTLAQQTNHSIKVIDMDPASVQTCLEAGIEANEGDAINPEMAGDEDVVTFNLILHHLVAQTERDTLALQKRALLAWRSQAKAIFVNEYIYESYIGNLSGWLIFQITKSALLSSIGRAVSKLVPSLKANTFGVGVRFRSHNEWREVFAAAGYVVQRVALGTDEPVSPARRLLMIKGIRRDSFLLVPSSLGNSQPPLQSF